MKPENRFTQACSCIPSQLIRVPWPASKVATNKFKTRSPLFHTLHKAKEIYYLVVCIYERNDNSLARPETSAQNIQLLLLSLLRPPAARTRGEVSPAINSLLSTLCRYLAHRDAMDSKENQPSQALSSSAFLFLLSTSCSFCIASRPSLAIASFTARLLLSSSSIIVALTFSFSCSFQEGVIFWSFG